MFVKPGINPETKEPFKVRIPHTFALLADEGQEVPDDYFWLWMRKHGDVVDAERPAEVKAEVLAAEGEPWRMSAAQWALADEANSGAFTESAALGVAMGLAEHSGVDPTVPQLTRDEYLAAKTKAGA